MNKIKESIRKQLILIINGKMWHNLSKFFVNYEKKK